MKEYTLEDMSKVFETARGIINRQKEALKMRDTEIDRLHEIIKCKNVLLVAYRLGTRKGVEKALDRLEALKGE
ncbi:hypothetical protein LCGC14_2137930 [marine sediment metagenome]|uniref:Uncharacterized protein n=1 Tax=marine sediment metagenome TaxID=412755 RepID=A0A0F9ELH1_9ZZZZ